MFRERLEEVFPASGAVLHAVEHKVARRAAGSADSVVRAVGIFDDGEKRPRLIGIEDMTLGERYRACRLDRIRRKIALVRVVRVVTQEVDGLPALTINDPKML